MKVTLQNIILPRLYTITLYIYIHTPRHRARVSITLSSTIGHPSHLTSFFLLSLFLSAQISPQLAELKVYPRMSPKKPIPINNPTANILWKLYPFFLLLHKHTRVYISLRSSLPAHLYPVHSPWKKAAAAAAAVPRVGKDRRAYISPETTIRLIRRRQRR